MVDLNFITTTFERHRVQYLAFTLLLRLVSKPESQHANSLSTPEGLNKETGCKVPPSPHGFIQRQKKPNQHLKLTPHESQCNPARIQLLAAQKHFKGYTGSWYYTIAS
jgi:hypothetical protein